MNSIVLLVFGLIVQTLAQSRGFNVCPATSTSAKKEAPPVGKWYQVISEVKNETVKSTLVQAKGKSNATSGNCYTMKVSGSATTIKIVQNTGLKKLFVNTKFTGKANKDGTWDLSFNKNPSSTVLFMTLTKNTIAVLTCKAVNTLTLESGVYSKVKKLPPAELTSAIKELEKMKFTTADYKVSNNTKCKN